MSDRWVVGDVQGFLEPFRRALTDVGLIDCSGQWTGGASTLVVLGDLVDRGPDGIGVIELLMRLQSESQLSGGRVEVVIGNHDVLLLAVRRFGNAFLDWWRASGGIASDLDRLTDEHVGWLRARPALLVSENVLLAHADAMFYLEYGATLEVVNDRIGRVVAGADAVAWQHLLDAFSEHRAFFGPDGCERLTRMLHTFGAERLVHGHTPIAKVTRQAPESVRSPLVYCEERCADVDPGIYLGGPGFAWAL
jgi:3',5'-cyclic AMP phosphodiesterase CpdA